MTAKTEITNANNEITNNVIILMNPQQKLLQQLPNDILILNHQNVIEYDHLTASQHDNICKIENKKELNESNLVNDDDEKLKLMKHGSLSGHITDIDKHEFTITPMELQSGASLSDGPKKK
eukprot:522072_1